MIFNESELKDLNILMEKVVNGEPFNAIEINKVRYFLRKIKDIKDIGEVKNE